MSRLIDVWVIRNGDNKIITFVQGLTVAQYWANKYNGTYKKRQAIAMDDLGKWYMLTDSEYQDAIDIRNDKRHMELCMRQDQEAKKKTIIKKIAKHLTEDEINVISE